MRFDGLGRIYKATCLFRADSPPISRWPRSCRGFTDSLEPAAFCSTGLRELVGSNAIASSVYYVPPVGVVLIFVGYVLDTELLSHLMPPLFVILDSLIMMVGGMLVTIIYYRSEERASKKT